MLPRNSRENSQTLWTLLCEAVCWNAGLSALVGCFSPSLYNTINVPFWIPSWSQFKCKEPVCPPLRYSSIKGKAQKWVAKDVFYNELHQFYYEYISSLCDIYVHMDCTYMHALVSECSIYLCPCTHVEVREHPQVSPHFHFIWEGMSLFCPFFQFVIPSQLASELQGGLLPPLPFIVQGLYMLTLLHPALCGFWRLELRSSDLSAMHLYSPQPGKFNPSSCFLPVYSGCRSGSSGCLERIPLT